MPVPTREMWIQKAKEFYDNAQFPLCIGAVDGKHIRIINPKNSGSLFFNYKHFFSIVLLAVCDANYLFTSIDVGAYGREGDSQIFWRSNFGKMLKNNTLKIPADASLPNGDSDCLLPYVIVGDEAFGLQKNIMRPYPGKNLTYKQRIFNYRLCRARRFEISSVHLAYSLTSGAFFSHQ